MISSCSILRVLLLIGLSVALPMPPDDDYDSVSVVAANGVEPPGQEGEDFDDANYHEYFGMVNRLLATSAKDPDQESGRLLSEWSEETGTNPEELGTYSEGDIRMPTSLLRNGLAAQSSRWPEGRIPFVIDPRFKPKDLTMIEEAFNIYHRNTCLQFVRHTGQRDYINITKTDTGCWSSVGRIGNMQEVNLQSPGCLTKIGTVLHELMHAAGFMHEQNRYDRDDYVSIHWENIEKGRNNNFDKAPQGTTDPQGVSYDYGSVMHYTDMSFSKNNRPTIVSKSSGKKMGQRDAFSSGDIQKLCNMYNCKCSVSRPQINDKVGLFFANLFGK